MKKLIVSVGLAAISASTLHAQYAPGLTAQEMAKPWSLSASLRGFYDDNYLTEPNSLAKSSYGVEVSPSISLNHAMDQTSYSLSYVYDLRWYERTSTTDSSHQFNARMNHTFSERFNMQANESFIIAQEPTVIDSTLISSPLRANGNNVHNMAGISGTASLTSLLDLQFGYVNNLYAYQQTFGDVYNPNPAFLNPSRSALLDRMEQLATVNLDWKVMPDLTGILGYQYGHMGYTSPEGIIFNGLGQATTFSQSRNNDSHFVFVGVDKDFNGQLHGSIRVGGEYLDYYNAGKTSLSPYVDANMTWQYQQSSYAQVGVKHEHNATDVVGSASTQPVLDTEATAAYASVSQRIAGDLTGNLLGQFQHSAFNGGNVDGQSEDFFIVGVNLAYRISPYLMAETGYNWNKLVSDISFRDYTRNQVYIGVRATY